MLSWLPEICLVTGFSAIAAGVGLEFGAPYALIVSGAMLLIMAFMLDRE